MFEIIFKIVQFAIAVTFVVFISDFRKKSGMIPLVNEKITKLLKLSYLFPLVIFSYSLLIMKTVTSFDVLALTLTSLGTFTATKAKLDLGICHTWTGYCKDSSFLKVDGIYAYIRHPLYTGIYLFIIGGLMTVITHAPWYLTTVALAMIAFIMTFLSISSVKETAHLRNQLGEEFKNYQEQVHPFLPVKRYIPKIPA